MSQITMKLFAILAILVPLAAADYYVTGYSDLECTVPISQISCTQSWYQCTGFGNWANSYLITRDAGDLCEPAHELSLAFDITFGCGHDAPARGGGCGIDGCLHTLTQDGHGNQVNAPADAATCGSVF